MFAGQALGELDARGYGLAAVVVVGDDEHALDLLGYLVDGRRKLVQLFFIIKVIVAFVPSGVLGEPRVIVAPV